MNFGNLQFDNCDDAQIYIAKRDFKPRNVGVSELKKLAVQIFPNPATNSLELVNLDSDSKGKIYTTNGSLLSTFNFLNNNSILDIQNLESGMYILRIESSNNISNHKFYKH